MARTRSQTRKGRKSTGSSAAGEAKRSSAAGDSGSAPASFATPQWVYALAVVATAAAAVPALSVGDGPGGKSTSLGGWPPSPLAVNVVLAGFGCLLTLYLLPRFRDKFIKARLFGIDLNKPSTRRDATGALVRPYVGPQVPEAMGVLSGTAFLVVMFLFIPVAFGRDLLERPSSSFPHAKLSEYVAALLSIACMCFLGFADNVLDLRWRHKLLLPSAATLPLLMVYYVNGGVTYVAVPDALRSTLGDSFDLGVLYYVYMGMLSVFCTNAINILAGVNGLESGQALVIGASILVNNVVQLNRLESSEGRENQLFSLAFMIPFVATTAALTYHNWYPSAVFVGDTFCYFAGMTFAVVAILGHFSKTLLLFFIPQVLNFLYSCPQLFKLIPCPRHRMPRLDAKTNKIGMSFCEFFPERLSTPGRLVYRVLSGLRLVYVEQKADGSVRMNNLTLINFTLYILGPMREDWLCTSLLAQQVLGSVVAFLIRYKLAGLAYTNVY